MQELMIDVITSLDGCGAAEGWPGWWGLEGPEYLAWLEKDAETERTLLLGSTTYRLMSGMATAHEEGVDSLTAAPKVVSSASLQEPLAWANTQLVGTGAIDAVRAMKADGERPLSTLGSLSLARSLLAADLVDRYRVVVFPVVTGKTGSDRIYDGWPDVALDLTETRTFDNGAQLFDFVPRLLDAPLPPGPGSS